MNKIDFTECSTNFLINLLKSRVIKDLPSGKIIAILSTRKDVKPS